LGSKQTSANDPCWESKEWTDALKADCVYRLGVCFQKISKIEAAEDCFRRYINLLLSGIDGLYSMDDAMQQIRKLHDASRSNGAERELKKAVQETLQASGRFPQKGKRVDVLKFDEAKLLPGRRVATKK